MVGGGALPVQQPQLQVAVQQQPQAQHEAGAVQQQQPLPPVAGGVPANEAQLVQVAGGGVPAKEAQLVQVAWGGMPARQIVQNAGAAGQPWPQQKAAPGSTAAKVVRRRVV